MADTTLLEKTPAAAKHQIPQKPSTDEVEKERYVRKLFDAITPRYDLFNRISSLGMDQGWRKRAVDTLELLPGMQVLDLASGTGDLAKAALKKMIPLGQVVGFDLSAQMLVQAQRLAQKDPIHGFHIQFAQGRAENLPFEAGQFDAATCGFALRNVSNLENTFQELARVLKPGGRIALLEFGRPQNPIMALGHKIWLATGVPLLGILLTWRIWPFLYLGRSIFKFLEPGKVSDQLRAAGFEGVKALSLSGGIVYLYTGQRPI